MRVRFGRPTCSRSRLQRAQVGPTPPEAGGTRYRGRESSLPRCPRSGSEALTSGREAAVLWRFSDVCAKTEQVSISEMVVRARLGRSRGDPVAIASGNVPPRSASEALASRSGKGWHARARRAATSGHEARWVGGSTSLASDHAREPRPDVWTARGPSKRAPGLMAPDPKQDSTDCVRRYVLGRHQAVNNRSELKYTSLHFVFLQDMVTTSHDSKRGTFRYYK